MNKISIFLNTYGQWQYTKLCLQYLLEGLGDADHLVDEIIIMDTVPIFPNVKDETQERLQHLQSIVPRLKVITLDKNYGCTITINKGIQACRPENDVMFVSNDVFMGHNWLQPLINCAYDPRWKDIVAWVSPFIAPEICLDTICDPQFRQKYFDEWYMQIILDKKSENIEQWLNYLYGGNFLQFAETFKQRNAGKIYDEVHSCTTFMKREIINKVGLLDERYSYLFNGELGGYGSDDIDMFFRHTNLGLFRLTCFDSFCHHLICGTNRKRTTPDYKDIQSGNKLLQKWEKDLMAKPLVFPFEVAGEKVPHQRFKLREIPLVGDPYKVDWGLPGQIGLDYMFNKNRELAFP